jgi:anti-sigma factor RsiW
MTEPAMTCRELVELVTAYFDDALSPRDRARFEEHIASCDACPTYVEQLRETIQLVGRLEPEVLSPAMEGALTEAFRDWRAAR